MKTIGNGLALVRNPVPPMRHLHRRASWHCVGWLLDGHWILKSLRNHALFLFAGTLRSYHLFVFHLFQAGSSYICSTSQGVCECSLWRFHYNAAAHTGLGLYCCSRLLLIFLEDTFFFFWVSSRFCFLESICCEESPDGVWTINMIFGKSTWCLQDPHDV